MLYSYGMPPFKELDPEVTRKLLEGHEDVLTSAVLKQDEFYRAYRCLRCKKPCQKEFVKGHVFADENNIAPRSCLRCTSCKCLFDPHSGLILENAG